MEWSELAKAAFALAQETATKYGPVAWDTILWLKRLEGIQDLILGGFFFVIFAISAYFVYRMVKWLFKDPDGCDDFIPVIAIPAFLGIVSFATSLTYLLDLWMWVALLRPELAIAHDLLLKAIK